MKILRLHFADYFTCVSCPTLPLNKDFYFDIGTYINAISHTIMKSAYKYCSERVQHAHSMDEARRVQSTQAEEVCATRAALEAARSAQRESTNGAISGIISFATIHILYWKRLHFLILWIFESSRLGGYEWSRHRLWSSVPLLNNFSVFEENFSKSLLNKRKLCEISLHNLILKKASMAKAKRILFAFAMMPSSN